MAGDKEEACVPVMTQSRDRIPVLVMLAMIVYLS